MEKKIPNHKGKKNKTSFKAGDKAAEKWTEESVNALFEAAIEAAKDSALTMTDIALSLDLYTYVFDYVVDKFPKFAPKKKQLLSIIENNTYKGALTGEFVPSVAIFGLKNNHGWTDKKEVDHKNDGGKFEASTSAMSTDELLKRAEAVKTIEEKENE